MQSFIELKRYVQEQIPKLNKDVFAGSLDLGTFITNVTSDVIGMFKKIKEFDDVSRLSRREAREVLKLLDFIVGSVERHYQAERRPQGSGLAALQIVEPLMLKLGIIAGTPPKGTAYTRWVDNIDGITFTGNAQELLFDEVVRTTHALVEESAILLRSIVQGTVDFDSIEAVDILKRITQLLKRAHEEYKQLKGPNFTPRFFAFEMRQYLPTYPIGGRSWGGVSAANLGAFWSLDYLLGTTTTKNVFRIDGTDGNYLDLVMHKIENVPVEIRDLVISDTKGGSMAKAIFDSLGVAYEDTFDHDLLTTAIANLGEGQKTCFWFARCTKAWASLASYHLSLIKSHLVKAADDLPPHQRNKIMKKLSVPQDKGSGGMGLSEVNAITLMRARHPILKPFTKIALAVESQLAA